MTVKKSTSWKARQKSGKSSQMGDLLDRFSPQKVGKVIPTTTTKRQNAFHSFRPNPGECLDYNISETVVKMDVGDTKINVKQTTASYVPAPENTVKPKKKHVKFCHGASAQWKFIDEIWREGQCEKQKQAERNFKSFVVRRKRRNSYNAKLLHNMIQVMVGPAWFQELSPKQLNTVDQLTHCIQQDYRSNTVIYTKDNVAKLGLVLRPNSKHVELALKLCCGSDIEFLLILYQLINPKRKSYSINDRLLLSAVVHLSISETLRELHVRIPSPPPRQEKGDVKGLEKCDKKRYKSPYLVPYTFKPQPQKYSGVYENKHIQWPENAYFSYIDGLRNEMMLTENILNVDTFDLDPEELYLVEDMKNAQKLYNRLPSSTGSTNLMRPTIKKACPDFENYRKLLDKQKLQLPRLALLEDTEEKCTCLAPTEDFNDDCCEFVEHCECDDPCCCKQKSKLFVAAQCRRCIAQKRHKNARNIIIGVALVGNIATPIIGGTFIEKECDCLATYKEKLMFIAQRNRLLCQKVKYVIGGVVLTRSGLVYLISGIANETAPKEQVITCDESLRACVCQKPSQSSHTETNETTTNDSAEEVTDCECKKELDSVLRHKCNCEQCNSAQAQNKATFILQGMKQTQQENTVAIIGGVRDQRCNCLNEYLYKLKKLDEYRRRVEARFRLKSQNKKFKISGVVSTPDGPVFCIAGVRVPDKCTCAELIEEQQKAEENAKRMAKMPPTGRIKYEIAGVRHGSEENTFIISKALPVDDCPCDKLYHAYKQAHRTCLDTFEDYLRRIEEEMDEYKGEDEQATGESEFEEDSPDKTLTTEETAAQAQALEVLPVTPVTKVTINKQSSVGKAEHCNEAVSSEAKFEDCVYDDGLNSNPAPTILNSTCEKNDEAESVKVELKRFVILDEIPRNRYKQNGILKKVLASMAEDGFPLAKLPDCHKLPHFKLWMELRSGKYWTQKDRIYYENFSKFYWKHTQSCHREIPSPKLNISRERANEYTWKNFNFCRELIEKKNYIFHSQLKQQLINGAREFFPLTFSYEFPTRTFRDCFFAYMPSKEEDVFVG